MDYFQTHSLSPDSHLLGLSTDRITALSPWKKGTCKLLLLQPCVLAPQCYFHALQLDLKRNFYFFFRFVFHFFLLNTKRYLCV